MKPQFTAAISKLIFGTALLLSVATVNAQSATTDPGQKESPAFVKYLGTQDDMIVFNVSYSNPDAGKFCVIVKDQDGMQLYQNIYTEKSFFKQFRLPKTDKNKITFIIRNYKDADIAKSFAVNINSRLVEDVAVRKVN
jgi:hypothetical protein